MKNKKLLLLLVVVGGMLVLSGCTSSADAPAITDETTLQIMMDTEGWWESFFIYPLAKGINSLSPILGVAGAVAVITIIVNAAVMLLTLKSTVATQKMQTLQPELSKIEKKYEGLKDQQSQMKKAQEMQALYSKHGINPLGSIVTMFIQLPILLAIYHAVQRAEAVKTGVFMGLSLEQTPMTGFSNGEYGYVILFIVMAICQFFSFRIPTMVAERKAKQKAANEGRKYVKAKNPAQNMMYYMMVMFIVMALAMPAAMVVYWIISALVNVAKTLLVQYVLIKEK